MPKSLQGIVGDGTRGRAVLPALVRAHRPCTTCAAAAIREVDVPEVINSDEEKELVVKELEDDRNVEDGDEVEKNEADVFNITSYGADYTVDTLVKRLDSGAFFIPPFQRLFVWNIKQASKFIESLLPGLPVPGIFVFREADTQKHLIIDGQQRLRSLQYFYSGMFRGKEFRLQDVRDPWKNKTYKDLEEPDRLRQMTRLFIPLYLDKTRRKMGIRASMRFSDA